MKQKQMLKKTTFSLLAGLGLLSSIGGAQNVLAAEAVYQHKDVNELTEAQKSVIQKGRPEAIKDGEQIIYVYQANGKCDLPVTPQAELPNTGTSAGWMLSLGLGVPTLGAAVYLLSKNKKGRQTFMVFVLAGTAVLGSHVVSADSVRSLHEQIEALVKQDATAIASPQDLDCFEYVGYIRGSQEVTTPVSETTVAPSMTTSTTTTTTQTPAPETTVVPGTAAPATPPTMTTQTPTAPTETTETTTQTTQTPHQEDGAVVVHFVDEEGNAVAPAIVALSKEDVGKAYTTTAKEITGYILKTTPANATGTVTDNVTEVTYVYTAKTGSVTVKYVDTEGNELQSEVIDTKDAKVTTPYETADKRQGTIVKDGTTYRLVRAEGTEAGAVVEGNTVVTYIYEIVKGNVEIRYVDTKGQELKAAETVVDGAATGTAYDTSAKKVATIEKDGITYKPVSVNNSLAMGSATESGKVVEGTTVVTYVYEIPRGTVVVNYVDTEGNKLLPAIVTVADNVEIGTAYDATAAQLQRIRKDNVNYIFKEVKDNQAVSGTVTEGVTTITYVYDVVRGNVVVQYLEQGTNKVLKEEVKAVTDALEGSAYDVSKLKEDTIVLPDATYYYIETDGNPTSVVKEGTTIIKYYYVSGRHTRSLKIKMHSIDRMKLNDIQVFYNGEELTNTDSYENARTYYVPVIYQGVGKNGTQIEGLPQSEMENNLIFKYSGKEHTFDEFYNIYNNSGYGFLNTVQYPEYGTYHNVTHDEAEIVFGDYYPAASNQL